MSASQQGERQARLPYLPGLDGLRAVAVGAVLAYHADLKWIPGGYLGVEAFFVISGYLITSLLLAEWNQGNGIGFRSFWLRRARRLLPAAFLVIVATLAVSVLFLPHEVGALRKDAVAAIAYVTNWYLVLDHKSYFEFVGRPSLLRHLWSLAVEEQFYVVWPLLFAVGMRLLRHRGMLVAVVAGAATSTAWMAILYQPDTDPSRIYYGTDTRAAALLVGAALAFVWVPRSRPIRTSLIRALPLDAVGLVAVVLLLWFFVRLDEFQPFLYQGGFLLVALTTAVIIAVAVHPGAHFGPSLLGIAPLRWVGLRSYGIYLWHWPLFMVTRPQLDLPIDGLPLLALRLAMTGVVTELSYRYVETPIRGGALGRAWRALRDRNGPWGRWSRVRLAGAAAVLASSMALGVGVVAAPPPAPPTYLMLPITYATTSATPIVLTPTASPSPSVTPTETPISPTPTLTPVIPAPATEPALPSPALAAAVADSVPAPTRTPAHVREPARVGRVSAIGDSVMLGAARELERAIVDIDVDAAVSRQASTAIDILRERHAAGQLGPVVIVHAGNNGTFSARQLEDMMRVLADAQRVVIVNVRIPRRWEDPNNAMLADGVKRYPNATLVDWHAASVDRPDFFWDDGIHLRPEGAAAYADLIATRLIAP